jgi:hypothetical protein
MTNPGLAKCALKGFVITVNIIFLFLFLIRLLVVTIKVKCTLVEAMRLIYRPYGP